MPGAAVTAPRSGGIMVGFHGKVPRRRDFVGRGLPRPVADAWHQWAEEVQREGGERFGDAWADAWRGSRSWRFRISAAAGGACSAVGVLVPSADKVGRGFPLIVMACGSEAPASLPAPSLSVDMAGVTPDTGWYEGLAALSGSAHRAADGADDLPELISALPESATAAALVDGAGREADRRSVWVSEGADGAGAIRMRMVGFPPVADFIDLSVGLADQGNHDDAEEFP